MNRKIACLGAVICVAALVRVSPGYGQQPAKTEAQRKQPDISNSPDSIRVNKILADIDARTSDKYKLVKEHSLPAEGQDSGVKLLRLSEKLRALALEPGQDTQVQLLALAAAKLLVPSAAVEPESELRKVAKDIEMIQHQSLDARRRSDDSAQFQKHLRQLSQTIDRALQLQRDAAAAHESADFSKTVDLILKRK